MKSERGGVGLAFLQGGRQQGASWARKVFLQSKVTSCMVKKTGGTCTQIGLQLDDGKDFINDPNPERAYLVKSSHSILSFCLLVLVCQVCWGHTHSPFGLQVAKL